MNKLPRLMSFKSPSQININNKEKYKDLPSFRYKDVQLKGLIGSGGFGKVYFGHYKNKEIVIKELMYAEPPDVLKEARFISRLKHENLVEFVGICLDRQAIMLEYVTFDLLEFGGNSKISALDELLFELDKHDFKGFEHLVPCMAVGIFSGLKHLHEKGIAHRDLKPGNVLVSNQHFSALGEKAEKMKVWKEKPCIAKLTDFGESWGKIAQSSEMERSHTVNVVKGTPAFMPPEIIDRNKRTSKLDEYHLKMADIWSFGMLYFCLVNPGLKVPFYKEMHERHLQKNDWHGFVRQKISSGVLPSGNPKYEILQATEWFEIDKCFKECVQMLPEKRPSLSTIKAILFPNEMSENFPLRIHQGSTLEDVQHANVMASQLATLEYPENDGTNACTFLAIKIAEWILCKGLSQWLELRVKGEEIIEQFPKVINPLRDISEMYEVFEAYKLMNDNGMISPCKFSEKSTSHRIFSEAGRQQFIEQLKSIDGICVFVIQPYTLLIRKQDQSFYVIDTHVIDSSLGGNGNGIIKVFTDTADTAKWIWKRLHASKVKSNYYQLFEISLIQKTEEEKNFVDLCRQDSSQSGAAVPIKSSKSVDVNGNNGTKSYKDPSLSQEFTTFQAWEKLEVQQRGVYKIPFIGIFGRKLKISEQLALVKSSFPRGSKVPQACRRNAIFLIDSTCLGGPEDVQSDLNGAFSKCLEIKHFTVEVKETENKQNVMVKANKKVQLGQNHLHMRVHRVENKFGLVRNVSYFTGLDGEIVNNTIVVQYFIDKKICGDVTEIKYKVQPHGNAKESSSPQSFYPLKNSTISSIHEEFSGGVRKRTYGQLYKSMHKKAGDFGDAPRSKKQLIDLARQNPDKKRHTGNEVEMLLAYNEEMGEREFVWYHGDTPSDLWVIGTARMIKDLSHAENGYPLSINPTFNHDGAFEVTPLTYRHQLLESKSKHFKDEWLNAVMIGPTIIHHQKSEEVYDLAVRVIARKSGLVSSRIGMITDDEAALITACKNNFEECISLRCRSHFKENCKSFLKSIGITGDSKQGPFLEKENQAG